MGMVESYLISKDVSCEYFMNTMVTIYGRQDCCKIETKSVSAMAIPHTLIDNCCSARKHAVVKSVIAPGRFCAPVYVPH